jgi:hypothetical protein
LLSDHAVPALVRVKIDATPIYAIDDLLAIVHPRLSIRD